MSLILAAAHFAREAHAKRKRKWSDRPYIEHPARVAAMITAHHFATEARVAAGWLHDVVEDEGITQEQLRRADFPQTTLHLVYHLTNQFTKENYPEMNRADRKIHEFGRLSACDIWVKIIKAFDRIDNLLDMGGAEAGFKRTYCQESFQLAEALEQNVHPGVNGLHIELLELTERIRVVAVEMTGHAASLFTGERQHYPLDGPPGARGL